jgi:hypothetical protein
MKVSFPVLPQQAWAVYDDSVGKVLIDTVHETRRGAVVNGLVIIYRVVPLQAWTDDRIFREWDEFNCRSRYKTIQVQVRPSEENKG